MNATGATLAGESALTGQGVPVGAYRSGVVRFVLFGLQIVLDALVIVATFIAVAATLRAIGLSHANGSRELEALPALVPIFIVVSLYARSYSVGAMQSYVVGSGRVLHAWLVTVAIGLLIAFTRQISDDFSRAVFLTSSVTAPLMLILVRSVLIKVTREREDLRLFRSALVEDDMPGMLADGFDRLCARTLMLEPDIYDPICLHNFSSVISGYDRVVVACRPERREQWALYLQAVGCAGELLMPELDGITPRIVDDPLHLPTIQVSTGPLDLPNRMLKRLLDLAITAPMIILFGPLMIIIAIAVKLDSEGPVFFRQQRMGCGNRLFNVYKFRSMRVEKLDFSGSRSATRDDDRITRVGRLIRMTSLDELPQLLNVLQGDMALVGPRPHALGSRAGNDLFWQVDPRYWLRHSIKPGITGLAQVRGYRGATDHRDDLTNRLRSDLEYVANWSIFRDLSILVRTATVLVHKNAY